MESFRTELQFLADAQERRLSKTFTPAGVINYPRAYLHNQRVVEVDLTAENVLAALQKASEAGECYVRGITSDRQAQGIRRLKDAKKWVEQNLVVIRRHHTQLHMFDHDNIILPNFTGDFFDVQQVGAAVAAELGLTCDVIAQFSASHGLKGRQIGMHLFVLTEQPHSDAALKAYAKTQNTLYKERYPSAPDNAKIVDPALFCDNQVHYIADPIFDGVADPLAGRERWGIIKGVERFWSGPPPVFIPRRKNTAARLLGGNPGPFHDQVVKLAAGVFNGDGVHATVLDAAMAGSKSGQSKDEVLAVLVPAALDGAVAGGREDAIARLAQG